MRKFGRRAEQKRGARYFQIHLGFVLGFENSAPLFFAGHRWWFAKDLGVVCQFALAMAASTAASPNPTMWQRRPRYITSADFLVSFQCIAVNRKRMNGTKRLANPHPRFLRNAWIIVAMYPRKKVGRPRQTSEKASSVNSFKNDSHVRRRFVSLSLNVGMRSFWKIRIFA